MNLKEFEKELHKDSSIHLMSNQTKSIYETSKRLFMKDEEILKEINKNKEKKYSRIIYIVFVFVAFLIGRMSAVEVNITNVYDRVDYNYVFSFARVNNSEEMATRISDCIFYYCRKKNINMQIYARLIWSESRYVATEVSYGTNNKPLAYGLGQVNLRWWDHKFSYAVNKKYAKLLLDNPKLLYTRVAFFIEANIDVSTDILRYYLNVNDGCYYKALTAYNGGQSGEPMRRFRNGEMNYFAESIVSPRKTDFYDNAKKEHLRFIEKYSLF
jgi:flagellar basal body-associated protein FliL